MEEPVDREETLKRVLDELSRRGYTEHFKAVDGGLQALGSGERFGSKDLTIRGYYRFEGTSDPDDMAIAYAIETKSGVRGILVDAFGVYADPATGERPGNLAHVHVALRVDRDAVRRREAAGRRRIRPAPARQHPAVAIVDADATRLDVARRPVAARRLPRLPPELRDVGAPGAVEHDVRRAARVGPLGQVLAVGAEDLDAVVLAVADEDAAVGGDGDAVGEEELARPLTGHAPRPLELARGREEVDAAVAVAVGHVELTLRPDREIRRPVERPAGLRDRRGALAVVAGVRGLVHGAERQQELALRRELPHGVVAVVRAVEEPVRADGDAVGAQGELPLAPRAQEVALPVVDDDRMIAAADQVDAILAVDRDARDITMGIAARKLLPPFDDPVAQRHGFPPPAHARS